MNQLSRMDGAEQSVLVADESSHLKLSKEQIQRLIVMLNVDESQPTSTLVHQTNIESSSVNSQSLFDKTLHSFSNQVKCQSVLPKSPLIFNSSVSSWIIDTGATDHSVSSITLFKSYSKLNHPLSIQLPNNVSVSVPHVGSVVLSDKLVLNEVLYIPDFAYNLISVGKLTLHNTVFNFSLKLLISFRTCLPRQ